ncbi:MAG: hypothetical protein AAF799_21015 [Myxococcota bacterium]
MRWSFALGFVSILWTSACFEDAPPAPPMMDGGNADTSESDCSPGAEGCECLEGECVGELSCLSNVCVDASATGVATTTADEGTGEESDTGSVDEGPAETGSPTTGGTLPVDAPCNPTDDQCAPGLTCNSPGLDGFVCAEPGPTAANEPCGDTTCSTGLICYDSETFDCGGIGCCTGFCDVDSPDGWCPAGFSCEAFYPGAKAPPGYEHVGVCV